jgi:hypothetical protein
MIDMGLSDRSGDVLSFGASKHDGLASCLRAYGTVELDLEMIASRV